MASLEYLWITVVIICIIVLVVVLSIIFCWMFLYQKHSKVRDMRRNKRKRLEESMSCSTASLKPASIVDLASLNQAYGHATSFSPSAFTPNGSVRFGSHSLQYSRNSVLLDDYVHNRV